MEYPEEESEWLFGDNLKDRVSQLKGENSVRDEFLRKWSSPKGKSKATRFTPYTTTIKLQGPHKVRGWGSTQGPQT